MVASATVGVSMPPISNHMRRSSSPGATSSAMTAPQPPPTAAAVSAAAVATGALAVCVTIPFPKFLAVASLPVTGGTRPPALAAATPAGRRLAAPKTGVAIPNTSPTNSPPRYAPLASYGTSSADSGADPIADNPFLMEAEPPNGCSPPAPPMAKLTTSTGAPKIFAK